MYLNCFMKDTVQGGSFLTKLDDKSGYDNVFVTNSSRKLLGFQGGGYYFCCNTLPFGWKNSAYVYHTCLLYIDDRLTESFHGYVPPNLNNPFMRAHVVIHMLLDFLQAWGIFLT